jgi:membrane protein
MPARRNPRWTGWRWDPTRFRVWGEGFRFVYWILRRTITTFRRDQVQNLANALAYRSLINLVPSLAFVFSLFAVIKGLTNVDLEDKVRGYLFQYLMPNSQLAELIVTQINSFVENAKKGTYIGLVLLLITAIFLFNAIEQSINQIWKVKQQRTMIQRFIIFTAVLIWGPTLVGLSFFLTAQIQVHHLILKLTGEALSGQIPIVNSRLGLLLAWLHGLVTYLVPFLLVWLSLSLFYITMPNTKVETRPALFSAGLAGFGWEVSKWAFGYGASYMALSREKIYASLAVFLVFLIWMYLTWVIVLFGAQLNYVIQNFRHEVRVDPREARSVTVLYLACRLMELIAGRYERGEELPSLVELAGRFGISIPRLRQVVAALVNDRILVRITGPEGKGAQQEVYQPNRELDQITLAQVIEAVGGNLFQVADLKGANRFQPAPPELAPRVDTIIEKVQNGNREILNRITLKQLVESRRPGSPATE